MLVFSDTMNRLEKSGKEEWVENVMKYLFDLARIYILK